MSRMVNCRGIALLLSLFFGVVFAGQGTPCVPFTSQSTATLNTGGCVQNPQNYGYPCTYAQVNCTWLLDAGTYSVQLQTKRFSVWYNDVMTIYDGPSTSSPIIAQGGISQDRVFTSSGSKVLIAFNTSMAAYWNAGSGFQIKWLAVAPNVCSGTLNMGAANQTLSFPVGGLNYVTGLDCKWSFSGQTVLPFGQVTVTALDLAAGDSLTVGDDCYGCAETALTNGMSYHSEYTGMGVVVHFKSLAGSATARGFTITFARVGLDLGCMQLDLCQPGVVKSIQVPASGQVRVCAPNQVFYSGRTCAPINCTFSFYSASPIQGLHAFNNYESPFYATTTFWDPNDPTFPVTDFPTTYDGDLFFSKTTRTGNITIHYYIASGCDDTTGAIFTVMSVPAAQCNSVANTVQSSPGGDYMYPLPYNGVTTYNSPMVCSLGIQNYDAEAFVYLNLVSSDIKNGDFFIMNLRNGPVFAVGGSNITGQVIYAPVPGMHVDVLFKSFTGGGHGFDLRYGSYKRTCNITACTNPQGLSYSVSSGTTVNIGNPCPNAVAQYQNSQTCRWTLNPPNGQYASIAFDAFSMLPGDLLTVYEGNIDTAPLLFTFSNTSVPSMTTVYSATAGPLFVKFTSDASGTARGFYARAFAGGSAPVTSLTGGTITTASSSATTLTTSPSTSTTTTTTTTTATSAATSTATASTATDPTSSTATATATASTAGTDGSTSATATATSAGTATATSATATATGSSSGTTSTASASGDAVITGNNGSSPAPATPVAIIGASAGGLVVLIIIVALIIVVIKKRNRPRNTPKASSVSTGASSPPPQPATSMPSTTMPSTTV